MCPDRQILSLYLDNELPSPWKEKCEAHLVSCPDCRLRFAKYEKLRQIVQEDIANMPDVKSGVWNRIIAANNETPAGAVRITPLAGDTRSRTVWNRSVSLPFPAAAAVAVIFVFVSFLALRGFRMPGENRFQETPIVVNIGSDMQGVFNMSDMNDVLQYLSSQDSSDFVTIKLPETQNFFSAGEPALIKAADYSRRNASR